MSEKNFDTCPSARHIGQPHALQTNVTNALDTPSAVATTAMIAGTAYTSSSSSSVKGGAS